MPPTEGRIGMPSAAQARYHARVVPRGERGSRATRIRWDRLGRVILVLVLFAVVASYIGPGMHVFESWRESQAGAERLDALKAENERLVHQARDLEGAPAAMVEARKLGLVGPGERPYVIHGLK